MRATIKKSMKTHQVEVIELFLAKLATLRMLSKDLKNYPIQLIIKSHRGVVDRIKDLPCKPGVAGSIPSFTSLSDETLSRGLVSI